MSVGGRRRRTLRRTLHRAGLLRDSRTLRALNRLTASLPTSGNKIEIFHDGDMLYARMLGDIRAATTRISMEMYMFQGDAVGRRFLDALAERSRAGVSVRVVYDAVGSFTTPAAFFRELADAGVAVVPYNPVAPWRRRFVIFRRNHRKTLIVDGRIGYSGGANIGLEGAGRRRGGKFWRDVHARVEGPAAGDLEVLFEDTWMSQTGVYLNLPQTVPREPPDEHGEDSSRQQVYVVAARGTKRRTRLLFRVAIARARRRIIIMNSYFIPDRSLRRSLYRARDRGVQVQLVLPGTSDVPITMWASQAFFARFLRRGMEIYLWQPTVLHAKSMVIDGAWSTVGSSNLDHFSLNMNAEADFVILDPVIGRGLEQRFERDLRCSKRVSLEEWNRRPWWNRLREQLAALVRSWL